MMDKMKYCWYWLLLLSNNIVAQKVEKPYFIEAGANISNIKLSMREIASFQLISGDKLGYYLSVGKRIPMGENWNIVAKVNISETGGNADFSAFMIKQKLPVHLEKYKNASLKIALYQAGIEGSMMYEKDKFRIYVGFQPSLIFYGLYKEYGVKNASSNIISGNQNMENLFFINDDKVTYNTFSLKGQIGMEYFLNTRFFASMSYHFGITNAATLSLTSSGIIIQGNQRIFNIGLGYIL